ncbi:hypothetical protein HU200_034844 [Digitaria exilis]|uniref:Protein kinase domain-containing protein n=1 Tax=Digitaria exilis TaxID=1010633 RepID=A0A835BPF7_9POAL|nr:hypothetical protein HU200_034844 [Digitaria exilis]CAB3451705.1 unnamed protein product [Digitaria exilis]
MASPTLLCILLTTIICINDAALLVSGQNSFTYNGFKDTNLLFGGASFVTQEGILSLTNGKPLVSGRGFHPERLRSMIEVNQDGTQAMASFWATFVFIVSPYFSGSPGDEMAFMISSTMDLAGALPGSETFFAIVLGVDLNYPVCISSSSTGYRYGNNPSTNNNESLKLSTGGKLVQLWAYYNSTSMELNVTVALLKLALLQPLEPLLSYTVDLSSLLLGESLGEPYAGLSASTGNNTGTQHHVLAWSFSLDGPAHPLNYTLMPSSPQLMQQAGRRVSIAEWLPAATVSAIAVLLAAAWLVLRWRRKRRAAAWQQEQGWEVELGLGPRRFSHKELRKATNGFSSRQLLGQGGFGRVYGGTLPVAASGTGTGSEAQHVAVKRISSESKHGQAQFMAEVVILGRLRHRNLVRLVGYCRHKDDMLLVYEHMAKGSLDRYLHDRTRHRELTWPRRFHVIKGVASGLLYLHEDWEQVIVHRDIKASNVLLDGEMNGRLGDFGLARLHEHGADAHTTHLAGTRGYIAPELLRFGKATKATDVFAFGAFILEVACGRRPMGINARWELLELTNWVPQVWRSRCIIDAMDPRLQDYAAHEAELVLKLGLLCSHPLPTARPGMRLVMQYLDGDLPVPDFSPDYLAITEDGQVFDTSPSGATTSTGLSAGR